MHHGAGDMRSEDVTESFRDITAGIHKLRLDSSAEEFVKQRVGFWELRVNGN